MEITLNLKEIAKKSLKPDEYVWLYLMYHKKYDDILVVFGALRAFEIRKDLLGTGYILDASGKFTETTLSNKLIELEHHASHLIARLS